MKCKKAERNKNARIKSGKTKYQFQVSKYYPGCMTYLKPVAPCALRCARGQAQQQHAAFVQVLDVAL